MLENSGSSYVAKVLFWFLAQDALGFSEASESNPYDSPRAWKSKQATIAEQFEYYRKADFWLTCDFSKVIDEHLHPFSQLFSNETSYGFEYLFPNEAASAKIKAEFPDIWRELKLDS